MSVCMALCLYVCTYVRTYVCMYVYVCVYVYMCVYVYVYLCMCVFVHVCVYLYVRIVTPKKMDFTFLSLSFYNKYQDKVPVAPDWVRRLLGVGRSPPPVKNELRGKAIHGENGEGRGEATCIITGYSRVLLKIMYPYVSYWFTIIFSIYLSMFP
jgi:hypothetical protein